MNRNTIKWRIFKYNIIVIAILICFTTVIFNLAVKLYIEENTMEQLSKIADNAERTALQRGPDFFPKTDKVPPPQDDSNDIFMYYFMLDRSLKETLTVLNADYILLDKNKTKITPSPEKSSVTSSNLLSHITDDIDKSKGFSKESYLKISYDHTKYVAIIKPVYEKNSFGLGWIVIYSSLQKVNQLQLMINIILFTTLIVAGIIIILFSSIISKNVSAPFSQLNQYIRNIAERNFGNKIQMPVYDELRELVDNINMMSEKLEAYDKAQKTFLQNASHEFRTPLTSIQSYAEGLLYEVVDTSTAAPVIIDETKRMTNLVEDLLYLSRLDALEESYHLTKLDFNSLIEDCIERLKALAMKNNIKLIHSTSIEKLEVLGDEEKLSRAITNIISNCIRYAESTVMINSRAENNKLILTISDDGPGFENNDLPNIFERFYKGPKGNHGLGLSISKNVIEKLNGKITAENSTSGALFTIELHIASECRHGNRRILSIH